MSSVFIHVYLYICEIVNWTVESLYSHREFTFIKCGIVYMPLSSRAVKRTSLVYIYIYTYILPSSKIPMDPRLQSDSSGMSHYFRLNFCICAVSLFSFFNLFFFFFFFYSLSTYSASIYTKVTCNCCTPRN